MPILLPKVKQELLQYGRNPADYPKLNTKNLESVPAPGIKSLMFKTTVLGETDNYTSYIQFFKLLFSETKDNETSVPAKVNNKVVYHKKPSVKENPVFLYCSCFTGDTKVMLADGYSVPIKDLVGKEKFYVYSWDSKRKKFVLGEASNCQVIEKDATLVEITFDTGIKIKCTPDHKFMLKDESWVMAKDLTPTMSLNALYKKLSIKEKDSINDYEMVLQPTGWEFTHRLTDDYVPIVARAYTRHHIDFNKRNNHPDNIAHMNWEDHNKLHTNLISGDKNPMHNPITKARMIKTQTEKGCFKATSDRMIEDNPMYDVDTVKKVINTNREKGNFSSEKMKAKSSARTEESFKAINQGQLNLIKEGKHNNINFTNPDWIKKVNKQKVINEVKRIILEYGLIDPILFNKIKSRRIPKIENIEKLYGLDNIVREATNHKIVEVKHINETQDVYCFTVKHYHNFVIDTDGKSDLNSGVVVHNCTDFRFRWMKPLYDSKGLLGNWKRYKDYTPNNPRSVNPHGYMGICKHIFSFLNKLKMHDIID